MAAALDRTRRKSGILAATLAIVLLTLPALAAPAADPLAAEIAAILERAPSGRTEAAGRHWPAMRRFYAGRDHRPLWLAPPSAERRAAALRGVLDRAAEEGLDPTQYRLPPEDAMDRAALEVAMSETFLRYATDLRAGRLAPRLVDPDLFVVERDVDHLGLLVGVAASADVGAYLSGLALRSADYLALKGALVRFRSIAEHGGWRPISDGPALKPGMAGPRVEQLRNRLESTGNAHAGAADRARFDPDLAVAVRDFQARLGLDSDGVVGPQTLAALNLSVDQRIRQLALNMERARWMPDDLGEDHILVNIAGFELKAVSGGRTALSMRVVIGKPYRQTPIFSEKLSYLELNPSWNVPTRVAVQDLLPKLSRNPGYFAEQGIAVFDGWEAGARPIDPAAIDWRRYSMRNFPFRLRQEPGPLNAMGRVKFMFPNRFSVYLHDTPARELFGNAKRAASSGCVRLEKPLELAAHVLSDQPAWTRDRIESVIREGRTQVVKVRRPIMIHITYTTAWVDDDGGLHFRDDIYGRDRRLAMALARRQ